MSRYIDAEPFDNMCMLVVSADERPVDAVFRMIYEAPTEDVAPVVHGYWKGKPLAGYCTVRCSVCWSAFLDNAGRWNYCPNCGAKMDGEV